MARLNITIPDALYTRLEQLRDRINLSKVCATALEKEVMMLEGQPNITDPRIARLVQRLQSTRERWYKRGYDDGIEWAVELATRDELQSVATHLANYNGEQLASMFKMHWPKHDIAMSAPPGPGFPHTAQVKVRQPMPPMMPMPPAPPPPPEAGTFHVHYGVREAFPGFPVSFHPQERLMYWKEQDGNMSGQPQEGEPVRVEVDGYAYLEGWRDAVKGIWETISPALS